MSKKHSIMDAYVKPINLDEITNVKESDNLENVKIVQPEDVTVESVLDYTFKYLEGKKELPNLTLIGSKTGINKLLLAYTIVNKFGKYIFRIDCSTINDVNKIKNQIDMFMISNDWEKTIILDKFDKIKDKIKVDVMDYLTSLIKTYEDKCSFIFIIDNIIKIPAYFYYRLKSDTKEIEC